MKTTINNDLIRSFRPCYDPSRYLGEGENLTVKEGVEKYRGIVPAKDMIWLLCRKEFMSDRDLRLFAVWCAREALILVDNPDPRSLAACDVAERFANGEATRQELGAAAEDAWAAAWNASRAAWAARAARAAARAADAAADTLDAADAAAAAAADAADAAYAPAKQKNQLQTADICRQYIGQEVIDKVNEMLK